MKKLLKVIPLALVVLLLTTGCGMKYEYGINIGKDKNVKLEFLMAQDDEMIDSLMSMNIGDEDEEAEEKTFTDAERWEYLENSEDSEEYKDFKAEKYDKDGFKGYIYSLDLGNIDDLVAENAEDADISKIGKDAKLFTKDGDTYKLIVKTGDEDKSQMEQYKQYVNFDVKLKVTLPNKAKSNNATKVEGNTYIWDLTTADSIELTFDFNGGNNTILYIGIACAAVVVIGAVVFVITKKKKTN